jgi:hypothetical protein
MKGIYTYIPETNHAPKENNFPAILSLLFMVPTLSVYALALMYFLHQHIPKYVCSAKYGSFLYFPNLMVSWYGAQVFSA